MYQTPLLFGKPLTKITDRNIMVTTPFMLTQTQNLPTDPATKQVLH